MGVEFTTVVGVDEAHLAELRLVWPTWMLNRPEILANPLLLVCDGAIPVAHWERDLEFLRHDKATIVAWDLPQASQREKMLNGLVFAAARHVRTSWYLKLDTDTVAVKPAKWIDSNWFLADGEGRLPAFVSSPWGYTKPPDAIDRLDDWGDTIPQLSSFQRLNLPAKSGAGSVAHPRIIGWCFFGRTACAQEAVTWCSGRLPVPSQDTFLWYVAERRGELYRKISMKRFGWNHVKGRRVLKRLCEYALTKGSPLSDPEVSSRSGAASVVESDSAPQRRSPSCLVASSLAKSLGLHLPMEAKGVLVGVIGDRTAHSLHYERPSWRFVSLPWGRGNSLGDFENSPNGQPHHFPNDDRGDEMDFVVLEGETDFLKLTNQIRTWWPRLRNGGIMAGINFGHPRDLRGLWGIRDAVNAFALEKKTQVTLPGNSVWLLIKGAAAL